MTPPEVGTSRADGGEPPPSERPSFGYLLDGLAESDVERLFAPSARDDAAPAESSAPPPQRLGRYLVLGEIARGGLGVVYRVRDTELGRDLALKVLQGSRLAQPELLWRFVEEAQVGGQLQHPGIVPVHEMGLTDDGTPYFTMKLIKGETLASLLAVRPGVEADRPRFLAVFEKVCDAVAYAHARGVLHRDLKPSNVMIGAFDEVYTVDWGLAKVLAAGGVADELRAKKARRDVTAIRTPGSEHDGPRSRSGHVLGTPSYMPPEQARGAVDDLDERSDVFGLGAILCEILTGHPPYRRSSAVETLEHARSGAIDDAVRRLDACGADARLVDLAKRCLAPEPRRRPRDAGNVARAMREYFEGLEATAREAELDAARARIQAAGERKAHRLTLIIAAIVLLSVVLGGGALWLSGRRAEEREAAARRAVELGLADASSLLAEVRAGGDDLTRWRAALDAAERTVRAADGDLVVEDLRKEARNLLEVVRREHESARGRAELERRNRELDDELAGVRLRQAHPDREPPRTIARAYEGAFRRRGVVIRDRDREDRLRELREVSVDVARMARCLDGWALAARASEEGDTSHGEYLLRLAQDLDPDPLRSRVRRSLGARDAEDIRKLWAELDPGKPSKATREGTSPPALAAPPSAATLELLMAALAELGDRDAALAAGRLGARFHPGDVWIHHALAALSGLDASRRHAFAVVALRQRDPHAWSDLGRIREPLGIPDAAARAYRRALTLPGVEGWVHGALARVLAQMGDLDEARKSCEAALEIDPEDTATIGWLADVSWRTGDVAGAIEAHRRLLELAPRSDGVHRLLGLLLEENGRAAEAANVYAEALCHEPQDPELHRYLGRAFLCVGRLGEAIAESEEAVRLKPEHARAHRVLALARADQGDPNEALRHFRDAVRFDPSVLCQAGVAGLARHGGMSSGTGFGIAVVQRIDQRSRDVAERLVEKTGRGHAVLGFLELRLDHPPAALAAFREAVSVDSEDALALEGLGLALVRQAEIPGAGGPALRGPALLDEAIDVLLRATELAPGRAATRNALAIAYEARGQTTEALGALRRAALLDARDAYVQLNLGVLLSLEGWEREGWNALTRAVELYPAEIAAHVQLGERHLERGSWWTAATSFRRALELDPSSAPASVGLARALLDREPLGETLARTGRALQLAPFDAAIHFLRGKILWKRGDVDGALASLRRAQDLDPGQKDAADQEGRIHLELGETRLATAPFVRALEIDPRSEFACRKLLELLGTSEGDGADEDENGDDRPDLDAIVRGLDRILASGEAHHPLVPEIWLLAWSRRPEVPVSTSPIEYARAEVERDGRRDARSLELLAKGLFAEGDPAAAVRTLEEALELPTATSRLEADLSKYRAACRPDIPTIRSVDAAFEELDEVLLAGSSRRYFPGASAPAESWTLLGFDDSSWDEGTGTLGYGREEVETVLEDMQGRYSSLYVRARFSLPDPGRYSRISLRVWAEDGCVVYLNGREVGRSRAGSTGTRLAHDATATEASPWVAELTRTDLPPDQFEPGQNVLAVHGLSHSLRSKCFVLGARVFGEPALPRLEERFAEFRRVASGQDAAARLAYLDGRLLQREGRHREAADAFRRVLAADRSDREPFVRFVDSLRARDDGRPDREELRAVLRAGPIPRSLAELPPLAPTALEPAAGAELEGAAVTLGTSPFFTYDAVEPHAKSHWQIWIETPAGERETVFDSILPATPDARQVVPRGLLQPLTTYHWRVAHVSGSGRRSEFSEASTFRTGDFRWEAVPVDLSAHFTHDVVANPGDTDDDRLDHPGHVLTVDGWNGTHPDQPRVNGLPPDGRVGIHQLGDYDGPNAIQLGPSDKGEVRIELESGSYVQLRFLVTGGNFRTILPVVLEYADGSSERTSVVCPDWFEDPEESTNEVPTPILDAMDRLTYPGYRLTDSDDPALFEVLIATRPDAVMKGVTLIAAEASFSLPPYTRFNLFAITAVRMEE